MGSPSPSTHCTTAMMSMNTSLKTTRISSHTCLPFGASSSWVIMVARHLKSSTAHWFWSSRIQQLRIPVHVAFHSRLLPAVKFIHCPPRCFNCHHTGHFTHSCGARSSCGLSMGDHDTRKCRASQNDRPAGLTPLKCAVCSRPHTAFDNGCPARKATIDEHRIEITNAGPYFPILSQCAIPGPFPGHGFQ